jgi:hypothetical protein
LTNSAEILSKNNTKDLLTKYSKLPTLLAVFLVAAMLVSGTAVMYAKPAAAASVEPRLIDGNPTCSDVITDNPDLLEVKIDPVPLGETTQDGFTINVQDTDEGQVFDWTAPDGFVVLGVLAKGGPNANFYDYQPDGATSDTGLHAPATPSGKWADLSHINFCYIPAPEKNEGLTPGFWKNNAENWQAVAWGPTGYSPSQKFSDVFDRTITVNQGGRTTVTDPTLLQALGATGGDINELARHGTAALLNAAHPEINYPYTVDQVIGMVQDAIDNPSQRSDIVADLVAANELGGGVDQHGNPI